MAVSPRRELQLPTAIPVLQYASVVRKFRTARRSDDHGSGDTGPDRREAGAQSGNTGDIGPDNCCPGLH